MSLLLVVGLDGGEKPIWNNLIGYKMFTDDVEFEAGWNLGQDDFHRGMECRFTEGYSEFADGYCGGYQFELSRVV